MNSLSARAGLICASVFSALLHAAPGDLDKLNFGAGTGTVFNPDIWGTGKIALQPDNKAVIVGNFWNGTDNDFYVVRYTTDGRLDTSFNATGKISNAVGVRHDYARSVAIQADGKIVVAGSCEDETRFFKFCVVRYQPNGGLDTTFNSTGAVITAITSGADSAVALGLQPDGKIVVAGSCAPIGGNNYNFCSVRYLANGAVDTTFNGTGKVVTACGGGISIATGLSIQTDGKILVVGRTFDGSTAKGCVARYLNNGMLDVEFGASGMVTLGIGPGDFNISAIEKQSDGKIVLAGTCQKGNAKYFCLARIVSSGALDTTFGGTGTVQTAIGSNGAYDIGSAAALNVQPDGKVLAAGACSQEDSTYFCFARYLSSGLLDSTFGSNGKVISLIGTTSFVGGIALQPDGNIIVGGFCSLSIGVNGVCLARYLGGPNSPKTLTEYVYTPLDYFFLTSRDTDKAVLDAAPGWARTGQSFAAQTFAEPGAEGISRFYFDKIAQSQTRGSHFYTLVDGEKAALNALNPTNQALPRLPFNEGVDSYAFPPIVEGVGGRCAAGQTPVYRAFRGQARFPDDPNHRFTTSLTLYNQLVAEGWDGEGVKMCVPN